MAVPTAIGASSSGWPKLFLGVMYVLNLCPLQASFNRGKIKAEKPPETGNIPFSQLHMKKKERKKNHKLQNDGWVFSRCILFRLHDPVI